MPQFGPGAFAPTTQAGGPVRDGPAARAICLALRCCWRELVAGPIGSCVRQEEAAERRSRISFCASSRMRRCGCARRPGLAMGAAKRVALAHSAALLAAAAMVLLTAGGEARAAGGGGGPSSPSPSAHTNNWAVIVCTSRYWLNYRHGVNAIAVYHAVKRLGIPDSHIVLMLADDYACNARNPFPGSLFPDEGHGLDVYGGQPGGVEVDYRGVEVTPEALLAVLTGRHGPAVPRSKRMLSDAGSNVLVYLTGHGGDGFLKFLDTRELLSQDLADALATAAAKGRYNELLVIAETCQASTLLERVDAPNVLAVATSSKGEQSLAYRLDPALGVSSLDRFTFRLLQTLEGVGINSGATMQQLLDVYSYDFLDAHHWVRASPAMRPLTSIRVTDFFGGVTPAARATPKGMAAQHATGGEHCGVSRALVSNTTAQLRVTLMQDGAGQQAGSNGARPSHPHTHTVPLLPATWAGRDSWSGVAFGGQLALYVGLAVAAACMLAARGSGSGSGGGGGTD